MRACAWLGLAAAVSITAAPARADFYVFAGGAFTFSQDAGVVVVPDVLTDDEATATMAIEGAGLVVEGVLAQCSEEMAGTVVDQNPDGGTEVAAGSGVSIWLSTGVACGDGRPPLWLGARRQRL